MKYENVVSRACQVLLDMEPSSIPDYMPYTAKTKYYLDRLAALKPRTIATQRGSIFVGDGESALHDLAIIIKDV